MDLTHFYNLGVQLAREEAFPKIAAVDMARQPGVYNIFNKMLGDNVNETVFKHLYGMAQTPAISKMEERHGYEAMRSLHTYMENVLRGKSAVPTIKDLPETHSAATRKRLIESLRKGREEVAMQQKATRNARLIGGGAVAAPVVGGGAYYGLKKESADDSWKDYAPATGAGVAASLPLLQGWQSGALRRRPIERQIFDLDELRKKIQPGDILLTGDPDMYRAKALVIASGADPHGYHVSVARSSPRGKKREYKFTHSAPEAGGAYSDAEAITGEKDIIIRRFKNQQHRKMFLENLRRAELRDKVLGETFGDAARQTMYDTHHGVKIGIKDLIPKFLRKAFASKCAPGATVCSTLPGTMSPVPLVPGVPGHELLPHHVQMSKELDTIGHYVAPRTAAVARAERIAQAVPWAARGLLGAGLGYGAYKGLDALLDRD